MFHAHKKKFTRAFQPMRLGQKPNSYAEQTYAQIKH